MNIVFLDAKTIGEDIDLSGYDKLGTVIKYGFSTTEEARERTKDADVVIVNKVQINETSIGEAEHLKLVCVTATGTNNLDKAYLDAHYKWQDDLSQDDLLALPGEMLPDIPRRRWHSTHLPCYSISGKN